MNSSAAESNVLKYVNSKTTMVEHSNSNNNNNNNNNKSNNNNDNNKIKIITIIVVIGNDVYDGHHLVMVVFVTAKE